MTSNTRSKSKKQAGGASANKKDGGKEIKLDLDTHSEQIKIIEEEYGLYKVLGLENTATTDAIKRAYKINALKWHPDRILSSNNSVKDGSSSANNHNASVEERKVKFQEIGYAYSVLFDDKKRGLYDSCGGNLTEFEAANTTAGFHGSGSGADNQEELEEYYRDLFSGAVDAASIEELSKAYIGSAEEYNDVVKAYLENNGDMNEILANCMFSEYDNANEHRYKSIIDRAIERNDIDKNSVGYTDIYKSTISTKETKARAKRARNEAKEAELLRIELGLDEKLKKVKKSAENKNGSGEDQGFDELKALIQLNKSKNKFDSFLDRLESKYSTPSSSSSSSKKKKGNKAGGSKTRK